MSSGANYQQGKMWEEPARRWVFHVDMDAFFASVEQLERPELRGLPVIVGNSPLPMEKIRELANAAAQLPYPPEMIRGVRGVVASASYEARAFGVRSAMPLARALALCPSAVVLPGRFSRYGEVAEQLRALWREFSPVVEPVSLDEAYLDMTGSELSGGPIVEIARRLKARIRDETGLTASVGAGPNKLVAKIASDLDKPDGLMVITHGAEARTLAPLSVRALPGVGPRTAEALSALHIATVGQLAATSLEAMSTILGVEHAASLLRRASGQDDSPVQEPGDPKSISRETTLVEDTSDLLVLKSHLRVLSDAVAWSLRREGYFARCVYIKLRLLPARRVWSPEGYGFGRLITRRRTIAVPTDVGHAISEAASALLDSAAATSNLGAGEEVVRLVGVGAASLMHAAHLPMGEAADLQPSHSEGRGAEAEAQSLDDRQRNLETSIDRIRGRFGFDSISLAAGRERTNFTDPKDHTPIA